MIDEVKFQELKDAAAHAKHNGGRVSVEWGDLDELLNYWRALQPPVVSAEQIAQVVDAMAQSSEPTPPAQPQPTAIPEAAAGSPEPSPDDAPLVIPEPTIQ